MSELIAAHEETPAAAELDLSPASMELIERFLRRRPESFGQVNPPEIEVLVAYLLGETMPDDAHSLEIRLTRDASARGLLRRVDQAVETIRQLDWDDVVQLAAGAGRAEGGVMVAVARIWQRRLRRQVQITPASLSRYLKAAGGWTCIRNDAAGRDQTLAWSTLNSVLQQSLRPSAVRPAYSAIRSGTHGGEPGKTIKVVGLPSRYREASVERAEISAQGALQVRIGLALSERWGSRKPGRNEKAQLELTACGQEWLLDEAVVTENSASWNIPNLGAVIGIATGAVDLSRLTLKFRRASRRLAEPELPNSITEPEIPETVTAAVVESDGRPSQTQPDVRLLMPVAPAFEAGRLRLTIGIAPAVRTLYAAYRLNIDLVITPERSQRLGSFPIDRWAENGAARILDIPWPGGAASRTQAELVLMLLQISLQAGAGSRAGNPET